VSGDTPVAPRWLDWARRLQAIAQNGLTYCENPFERERYEQVRAVAAEMAAAGTGDDAARLDELFAGEIGYATPKVDVRGVCFRDGRLLLVRGSDDRLWTVPGGWADIDERPSQAVEKEVREEAGYRARAVRLIGLQDRRLSVVPFHAYKLFFLCELDGEPSPPEHPHEVVEVGLFGEDELPPLSKRAGSGGLVWTFDYLRDPDRPARFD